MKKKSVLGNESGQSTMEFVLTLVFLMGFVLFYFQLAMVSAFGNYVHYATFMAARAYLSGNSDKDTQREQAKNVLVNMVKRGAAQAGTDKWPSIAKGYEGEDDVKGAEFSAPGGFNMRDAGKSWMEGVRYTFKGRLFILPLGGSVLSPDANSITLKSESWLGREPNYDECIEELRSRNESQGGDAYFDNGC